MSSRGSERSAGSLLARATALVLLFLLLGSLVRSEVEVVTLNAGPGVGEVPPKNAGPRISMGNPNQHP